MVNITDAVKTEGKNLLVIKMDNVVSSDTLPVGAVHKLRNSEKVITPGFDSSIMQVLNVTFGC